MDWAGWAVFGVAATAALTALLIVAQMAGLTRLGFAVLGLATWWLGAIFGLLHVGLALTAIIPLLPGVHPRMSSERAGLESRTVLEPPGLLVLNYGRETPLVATIAHVIYGVVLGLLINPS